MVNVTADGTAGGAAEGAAGGAASVADREFPPIAEIAVAAMSLIIAGGITLASRLPHPAPLPLLTALLAAAAALVLADVILLARLRDFAWPLFFRVANWTMLAYAVMYGILEFTFIYDHVTGATLAVVTLMLVVFAIDIPLLFGFSVARYATPDPGAPTGPDAAEHVRS